MNAEEKEAIKLIKKHLPEDAKEHSYQKLLQFGFYGFMEYYLQFSKHDQLMSTNAKYIVTIRLAEIDKQRENKNDRSFLRHMHVIYVTHNIIHIISL